ncbi:DNA alkylation repair protein [Halothermothrix orenii]|uniref:DNA alkylation repair enzyme n=1 Tax=Halothermothrix orenii (strain H 168 / OCM 544 / DSM 9562) TaxID=373903 RepID=B8D0Y1_HALOH|nr:DNA alkylation repair protein [Halothermothrix orenii]ACL68950.1 DNA alkylation repair enzyme [Halothermothrix orenii H 168]
MNYIQIIKQELYKYREPEKADFLPGFFKCYPGGYGEGDQFIGVRVPHQRKVAKKYYKQISLKDVSKLLNDPVHEYRLTGLFILINKYQKADQNKKQEIVDLYLNHLDGVNNWDLVDSSADKILGDFLFNRDKSLLYKLAKSGELWKQRIAIIATKYFIKKNQYRHTLEIAKLLLNHDHDLIHKAVGWMLREVGKRNQAIEINFLKKHYKKMPRTMLRYAIEKFEPKLRKKFLNGQI